MLDFSDVCSGGDFAALADVPESWGMDAAWREAHELRFAAYYTGHRTSAYERELDERGMAYDCEVVLTAPELPTSTDVRLARFEAADRAAAESMFTGLYEGCLAVKPDFQEVGQ